MLSSREIAPLRTWYRRACLLGVVVVAGLMSGPAAAQCVGSVAPVIKNSVALTSSQPRGLTYVETMQTFYVPDRFGPTERFSLNLAPLPPIQTPGPAATREIAGIAWEETMNILIWLDVGNMQIYHTNLMGQMGTSIPLTPVGAGEWGDFDKERNFPSAPPWPPKMFLPRGDEVHVFDALGVYSGVSFPGTGDPGLPLLAISSRKDNRDLQVPKLTISGGVCVDKVGSSGGPVDTGVLIDALPLSPPIRGLAFVLVGSDGMKSHFLVTDGSDTLYEISGTNRFNAFIRGDANEDGVFNIADPVRVLSWLFGGGAPLGCDDAGDANNDETVDVADAVAAVNALFGGGPMLPGPHPYCGDDGVGQAALGCANSAICP